MMKIITKKVDEEAKVVEYENFGYEEIKEVVGGWIECFHVGGKVDIWLNDEGKLLDLPANIGIVGTVNGETRVLDTLNGDIAFAGTDGYGETIGLEDGEVTWIMNKLESDGLVVETDDNGMRFIPAWFYDPTVN